MSEAEILITVAKPVVVAVAGYAAYKVSGIGKKLEKQELLAEAEANAKKMLEDDKNAQWKAEKDANDRDIKRDTAGLVRFVKKIAAKVGVTADD